MKLTMKIEITKIAHETIHTYPFSFNENTICFTDWPFVDHTYPVKTVAENATFQKRLE